MKGFRFLVVLLGFLAACGGGGTKAATTNRPPASTSTGAAACRPNGTSLQASADNLKFTEMCLAAPANTAFTILFENRESFFQHNISIYTADRFTNPDAKQLFKGQFVYGPDTITYHVSALPPGVYRFQCDVHPFTMNGIFIVS